MTCKEQIFVPRFSDFHTTHSMPQNLDNFDYEQRPLHYNIDSTSTSENASAYQASNRQ